MFCRKALAMNRWMKTAINSRKMIAINGKQMCHRVDTRGIPKPLNSGLNVTDDYIGNQFLNDRSFRLDILQNVFVLAQNVVKGKQSLNQLIDEKDLKVICDTIETNVNHLKNNELINGLQSFLAMGLNPNLKIVQCLENEVLWRTKNMSLKEILKCLSFHVRYESNEQQIKVVKELIIYLVLKLDKAEDLEDTIEMLTLWRSLTPQVIERVERISVEMIARSDEKYFKFKSLSYLLVLLSQMNRRSKPLIDTIVKKFTFSSFDAKECEEKHLIQMISALNQLNYSDINFLKKSCDLLCNKNFLNTVRSSDRRDLLVSISQSNWFYPRLLDQFIEKITETNNDFSTQDFLVFVSSFGRLYYRSRYINNILTDYVIPYVRREDLDCESWLLYVWSLSILGCVPSKCINSVINNDFYNELKSQSTDEYKQIVFKQKLLNIKAVAELEMKETINSEALLTKPFVLAKREASVESFKKSILQSLNTFIPNLSTNNLTPFGFAIDAEFITNENNESLSLEEYGILGADTSKTVKPLPDGFKRCALMCFGFNDTLLGDSGLIGVHELSIRLLKRLGYSVVVVNQNQFKYNAVNVQNIERLKSIVNKSLN